jgi:hypothetical protein
MPDNADFLGAALSNREGESPLGALHIRPSETEKNRLRQLAERYAKIAASQVMKDRKRQWKALNDLKPEKPMILVETQSIFGFLDHGELQCKNEYLRNVEKTLLHSIKQYELLGDDIVFEPYFRIPWRVIKSHYGPDVQVEEVHAENSLGYLYNFPIKEAEDLKRLWKRTFVVDRECSLDFKNILNDIFGDILPPRLGNFDTVCPDMGFQYFVGNIPPLLTMDLFRLLGYETMNLWVYDEPEALKELIQYIADDWEYFLTFCLKEKLMTPNTDNQLAVAGGYGYVSDLPSAHDAPTNTYMDCWTWVEAEVTSVFSPAMYADLFLPHLAAIANKFGLVNYGCCEPLHDRIELIKKAIPRLRGVTFSAWSDIEKLAAATNGKYVCWKKPSTSFLTGNKPDWEGTRVEIQHCWDCLKYFPIAIIVRDLYDIADDLKRLPEWVSMVKKITGQ